QIQAFYTTGQHNAAITDNRIRAAQLLTTGGPTVKEAAEKALREGSPKAVTTFLIAGQYTARQIDERVQAAQLLTTGGPEVQSAAKLALVAPPDLVTSFLQTGQYMADRKDQLAATHAAQMRRLIAEASQTAARAQQDAWEATAAAAVANNAAAEANAASGQARTHADQASQYAADAKASAQDAATSATRAGQSATTARTAAQNAASDAGKATASALRARTSAAQARWSASAARSAAGAAYTAARAAGKDATQAQQAADQAWAITAEKQSQERQAELAAEDAWLQGEAKQIAQELQKEMEAQIREDARQASRDAHEAKEYSKYNCFAMNATWPLSVIDYCQRQKMNQHHPAWGMLGELSYNLQDEAQLVRTVAKSLLGVDSAEECVQKKTAFACVELAAGLFPAGKAVKVAQLLKKAKTVEEAAEASRISRLAVECLLQAAHSFPAGTPVLMADGSAVPIERVRAGDYVLATDPVSGSTGPRRVDATIYTPDDRDFVDLTIQPVDSTTGTVTSTGTHPFWAQSQHAWRNAADLTTGDTLRTADGQAAQITATKKWTASRPAFDLTINEVHTYYVLAGNTPVLVHNSTPGGDCGISTKLSQKQYRHIQGRSEYGGGGYFTNVKDAHDVLAAYHAKRATVLGRTSEGHLVVRYDGVTGYNNNPGVNIYDQPTNVFMIKGTSSPSIVPINPNWTP
ncbi:polymorphic toxin-type HINT domain-containing protein, partial [Kitasatospora sp. NPDC001574]